MAGADLGAHIEPESFNAVMGYEVPRPTSWNVGLKEGNFAGPDNCTPETPQSTCPG